jgi:hypothetical protein
MYYTAKADIWLSWLYLNEINMIIKQETENGL